MAYTPSKVDKVLNTILFSWPGYPTNKWTIRHAMMGTQIFGSTGSGKSSGSGRKIAKAFLKNKYGGIVLCAKPGERKEWEDYAKDPKINRYDDLVIINSETDLQFNPIIYELTRSGKGAGETINLVNLLMTIHELGKSFMAGGESRADESFWDNSLRRLISRVIDLLRLSNEEVSFSNMRDIIQSAISEIESDRVLKLINQINDRSFSAEEKDRAFAELEDWKKRNYCLSCLLNANDADDFDAEEQDTFDLVFSYFTRQFAKLSVRTRSIIEESFMGIIEPFSSGILKKHFSKGVSAEMEPENTFKKGKIIILDFSLKEHLLAGLLSQGIYKYVWQQAMERREIQKEEDPIPCFLWIDESQFFVTEYDMLFATTARSSLVSITFLTQNIDNYYASITGDDKEARTRSLLGNLSTTIYHSNSNYTTNEFASKSIGEVFRDMLQASRKSSSLGEATVSEALHYQVLPMEFTVLEQGGQANNGYKSEAIVTRTGEKWGSEKVNYGRMKFDQNE